MYNTFLNLVVVILIVVCLGGLSAFSAAKLDDFLCKRQAQKQKETRNEP